MNKLQKGLVFGLAWLMVLLVLHVVVITIVAVGASLYRGLYALMDQYCGTPAAVALIGLLIVVDIMVCIAGFDIVREVFWS